MKHLTSKNSAYPPLLKEIHNPPENLYLKGNLELLNTDCIAIVGSRKCSWYGEKIIRQFIPALVNHGFTIVSGMAKGIDTLAHEYTINQNGKTIAVLGTSIDYIYPRCNENLHHLISQKGLLVSEHPEKTEARPYYFPIRNRIISGLSIATLIVEAAEKSGALITAQLANEQGREVFTFPGSFDNHFVKGNHQLLKNGEAALIDDPEELIEKILNSPLCKKRQKPFQKGIFKQLTIHESQKYQKVLEILAEPLTFDELKIQLGGSTSTIMEIISEMELAELLQRLPGGVIAKK